MGQVVESTTSVTFIYKHRYSDRQSAEIAMRDHSTLNDITKEEGLDGIDFNYAMTTGNPQGIADDFPTAQQNAETLQGGQLAAIPFTKYADLIIDGPSMLRAKGGKASFYDLVTRSQDGILDELGAEVAFNLQRDRSGVRGQVSAINGNVVTLTNKRDVENFKRKMTVAACTGSGGTGIRAGQSKVVGLNRSGAQVTFDDVSTITGLQVGDYLGRKGGLGTGIEGMELCTPLAAPVLGSDSFRGLDRGVDIEALAGSRIDDTARYPEELAMDLAVEMSIIGKRGKGWVCTVFPTIFAQMAKRLGAKVEWAASDRNPEIGYEYFTIITPGGSMRIRSDSDARYDRLRVWNPETHSLKCLETTFVHLIRDDGRPNLRTATSDGLETRARFIGNYVQYDASSHGVGSVAPS